MSAALARANPLAVLRALPIACALMCVALFLTACFSISVTDPDVEAGTLVQLTHTDATEENPVWSPVDDKVAFECSDDAWLWDAMEMDRHIQAGGLAVRNWPISFARPPASICVVNADGSGLIQLTDDLGDDTYLAWSPDGRRLAFVSNYRDRKGIYIINSDGTGLRRIARDAPWDQGPVWSPDGSELAFTSFQNGQHDIVVVRDDGTGRRQITNDELKEESLAWHPDGSKIVYRAYLDIRMSGNPTHIYAVNSDGSDLKQITDSPGSYSEATLSPDGSQIAFIAVQEHDRGLTVMRVDGGERTLLYRSTRNAHYGFRSRVESPAWSPDGTRIAFAAQPWNGGTLPELELYVINAGGTGLQRLTHRTGADSKPTWSPDGSKLAFVSHPPGGPRYYLPEIYALADFNPVPQPLTDIAYSDRIPVWSPDGTRIAYVTERLSRDPQIREYGEVHISNADGSGKKQLTDNNSTDTRPAWSPDNTRIAYVSDYDGDKDIYTINADGSGIKRLTNNDHPDSRPVWSPDGSRIAYVSLHNGRHTDIFVMNADGSGIIQLTSHDDLATRHYNGAPSWSTDGKRIAYVSAVHGQYQRHVMNSDGTQRVTASVDNCLSYDPAAWSPDSTMIAFGCHDTRLHMFNPSDGTVTSLEACDTDYPPMRSHLWSADNTHIAYTCYGWLFYKISADDGTITRYKTEGCMPEYRAWSPDQSKVAILTTRDRVYDLCVEEPILVPATELTP